MKRWRRHRLGRPSGLGAARMDRALDGLVPQELRHLSRVHWTPVDIAARVVTLICPTRDTRVLDIGAGVGKVCAVGALSAFGMWSGVEQHASLVAAARRLAKTLDIESRTSFVHGDAFALDWDDYDALYLYNPFEISLLGSAVEARAQASRVEARLARLRRGIRVVTLHGFGGVMPPSFELVYQEHVPAMGHDLVLWMQR
jgi:hypothetical protein